MPETERATPQQIVVDVELEVFYRSTGKTPEEADALEATVDYARLPEIVQQVCAQRPFQLLERLAEVLAQAILTELEPAAVTLRIHKPNAARELGCGAVVLEQRFEHSDAAHGKRPSPADAFVALGSNLGDRQRTLDAAVQELRRIGLVRAQSRWIETEPEGGVQQPRYLNGVVQLMTSLSPHDLLDELLSIELRFGRRRPAGSRPAQSNEQQTLEKPSRTLDLDLLLYDDVLLETETLELPHPRLHLRSFVLEPLAEIAPHALHPRLGATVEELQAELTRAPGSARSGVAGGA